MPWPEPCLFSKTVRENSLFLLKGENVGSLQSTFKGDSKKPDDNDMPGFCVSTLGAASRGQGHHLHHHRCRCWEPILLFFSYVIISRQLYLFFLMNCHGLWSTSTLSVGTWQTPVKVVDEFHIFLSLFLCLIFTLWDLKMLECDCCSCMIKAFSIAALKYRTGYTQHAQLYYFIISSPQSCYL